MSTRQLVDSAARHAIRSDLTHTFVVEAAAGTGKTTELVQRIVATVESGRGRLSSLVAVTFTEKAAGEMKLRIRTELDRALGRPELAAETAALLRTALRELEAAKIGTIHALCADLLREHPVEARVDPAFEVSDGTERRRLIERAFDTWFERTLEDPPEGVRRVLRRRAHGERGEGPRAELFSAVSSLIDTRDFDGPYRRDPLDRAALVRELLEELRGLSDLGLAAHSTGDYLAQALRKLASMLRAVASEDLDTQEAFLSKLAKNRELFEKNKGKGRAYGQGLERAAVLARRAQAKEHLDAGLVRLGADLAGCLQRELTPVIALYDAEKNRAGSLDFFDLLLCTRDLLRDHPGVRTRLQAKLTHVLVDEFQDTDPVQSEILLLLAADDGRESDARRVRPVPGKLFVVGDPKQSIYRFRRADVSLYERVKAQLVEAGARVLYLSTSFRSLPAIQSLVNASFAPLMTGRATHGEATYVPLAAFRAERPDQPAVIALPAPAPYSEWGNFAKSAIDACLPDAVAAFVHFLVSKSGFRVRDGECEVPIAPRHVCLLFRRFNAYGRDVTREYVRALEARRIPHVLSGGRSFHAREEVLALRSVANAIEWPDDSLSVYATLRGPFVGFHDETLFVFKQRVGPLHPLAPLDLTALAPADREVAEVLALLGSLHKSRNRKPIAETLASFLTHVRAHAGIAIWPTGEQALGNVLRLLDLARAYERRRGPLSFRGFVGHIEEQAELNEASEACVIEEGSEGVRIMTVHAAKGLEFPVVVLCDPTAPKRPDFASRYVDPDRKLWAQTLCGAVPIELVEQRELVRDHDEAELVRLLYVAATRAKDMLVVPTCGDRPIDGWIDALTPALYPTRETRRAPSGSGPGCPKFTGDSVAEFPVGMQRSPEDSVAPGEHTPSRGEHRVVWWDPHQLDRARPATGGLRQADLLRSDETGAVGPAERNAYEAFRAERVALRLTAAAKSWQTESVTTRAQRVQQGPAGALDVVNAGGARPARPGGTRFGTLVHAVLAHASLEPRASELAALAAQLGRPLGASADEMTHAATAVETALGHPLFERARAALQRGELYREVAVTARDEGGTLLDGVADLVFREPDGLVLVDYKTDAELFDLTVYEGQLSLYARALEQVFGERVTKLIVRV